MVRLKCRLLRLILDFCWLISPLVHKLVSNTCLLWEFLGITWMILVSIQTLSSFQYWSNLWVSSTTPYSFPVYLQGSMVTRVFLVAFLVCSSFIFGNPGVNWEISSTPKCVLLWSCVIRGEPRNFSGPLLVSSSFSWIFWRKLGEAPYHS